MNIITDCYTDGSPTLETLQITCWHTPLSLTCWLTEKSVSSLSAAVASLYHAGGGCVAPGTTSEHYTKGGSPVQLPNTTLREGLLYNFRTSREDLLYNFRTLHHERISCIQPRARPLLVGYKENIKMIFPWFKIQTKKNP